MPETKPLPKFLLVDPEGKVYRSDSKYTVEYAAEMEMVAIDLENSFVPWMQQSFVDLKDVTEEADEHGDLEVEPEED